MEVKEKNCVITLTYTEKQPSNTQRSIQIQKKPLREVEIKGSFLNVINMISRRSLLQMSYSMMKYW